MYYYILFIIVTRSVTEENVTYLVDDSKGDGDRPVEDSVSITIEDSFTFQYLSLLQIIVMIFALYTGIRSMPLLPNVVHIQHIL